MNFSFDGAQIALEAEAPLNPQSNLWTQKIWVTKQESLNKLQTTEPWILLIHSKSEAHYTAKFVKSPLCGLYSKK
jgi:hypothetical protein